MSLNRYEVLGKIADGGLGSVYKAYDRNLRREVALKRVRADSPEQAEQQAESLINEARSLSSLQHPHIVTIYDVGRDEEGAYLVMELLKGETLENVIERGALNEYDFRELVTQSLEGMIAAHATGLIHLDIKPQNFMMVWLASGKFQIKILDFGLAKIAHQPAVQETDEEGAIMGSIFFMAPEQFERSPVDVRTDLYSLGCVYYYALTQNYPFGGETAQEVMASHLYHSLVMPLAQMRPDLPPFIHQWVDWLMSRVPDQRPTDVVTAYEYFRAGRFPNNAPAEAPVAEQHPHPNAPRYVRPGGGGVTGPLRSTAPRPTRPLPGGSASQPLVHKPGPRPIFRPVNIAAATAPKHLRSRKAIPKSVSIGIPATILVLAALIFWFHSHQVAVRQERLTALLQENKPNGTPLDLLMLLPMLDDPSTSDDAGKVLAKLQGVDATDEKLTQEISKLHPPFAEKNLVNAIGARRIHDAAPELLKTLSNTKAPDLRLSIWKALARCAQGSDVTDMLSSMAETTGDELHEAEIAVAAAARTDINSERRSQPIVQVFRSNSGSDDFRAALIRLMGKVAGNNSLVELRKALKSSNIKLRTSAIYTLGEWPNGEPLSDLMPLLGGEKSSPVRNDIIKSIGDLASRASDIPQSDITGTLTKAFAATKELREQQTILGALGKVADQAAGDFAKNVALRETRLIKQAEDAKYSVMKLLKRVIPLTDAITLEPAKGELTLGLLLRDGVVTNWTNITDQVNWVVQVDQPVQYDVTLMQSSSALSSGRYSVEIGKELLDHAVELTTSPMDFRNVSVGRTKFLKPGIYRVWVQPLEIGQDDQLMHLKGIALKKSG